MRQIHSKDTKIEMLFKKLLWANGLRYKKNNAKLFGKPDISFINKRTVIFTDSCFWHGCVQHLRLPKSNTEYWENKIQRNRNRDREVNEYYKIKSWRVIRVWEHEMYDKDTLENLIKTLIQPA